MNNNLTIENLFDSRESPIVSFGHIFFTRFNKSVLPYRESPWKRIENVHKMIFSLRKKIPNSVFCKWGCVLISL